MEILDLTEKSLDSSLGSVYNRHMTKTQLTITVLSEAPKKLVMIYDPNRVEPAILSVPEYLNFVHVREAWEAEINSGSEIALSDFILEEYPDCSEVEIQEYWNPDLE